MRERSKHANFVLLGLMNRNTVFCYTEVIYLKGHCSRAVLNLPGYPKVILDFSNISKPSFLFRMLGLTTVRYNLGW